MEWKITDCRLHVGIETEGALKALGHDRTFDVPVRIDITGSPDEAEVVVNGELEATEVVGEISARDRRDILKRMHGEVLRTDRHPRFSYRGRLLPDQALVEGKLTLRGETRDCNLPLTLRWEGGRFDAEGSTTVDLADFGIRPYKALMGALRVKTPVTVSWRVSGEAI